MITAGDIISFQATPFSLARPLIRFAVIERSGAEAEAEAFRGLTSRRLMLLVAAHICCDAKSLNIAGADISRYLQHGEEHALPVDSHFLSYVLNQTAAVDEHAALKYWTDILMSKRVGPFTPLTLAADTQVVEQPRSSRVVWFDIPSVTAAKLSAVLATRGCTLYAAVLAAYALTLSARAGVRDVTLGTSFDLRLHQTGSGNESDDIAWSAGCFSCALPVRLDMSGAEAFLDVAVVAARASRAALARPEVPLLGLIESLRLPRTSPGVNPLFSHMLSYVNKSRSGGHDSVACTFLPYPTPAFAMWMGIMERPDGSITGYLECDILKYGQQAEGIVHDFLSILKRVADRGENLSLTSLLDPNRGHSGPAVGVLEPAQLPRPCEVAPSIPEVPSNPAAGVEQYHQAWPDVDGAFALLERTAAEHGSTFAVAPSLTYEKFYQRVRGGRDEGKGRPGPGCALDRRRHGLAP